MKINLFGPLLSLGIGHCLLIPAMGAALRNYTYSGSHDINVSEASGVTYDRDTDTLFAIGDEGFALYQISKTGAPINSMTFDNSGPAEGRTLNDPEGVSYLGNGKFMIADERRGMGWVATYAAGTQVGKGTMPGYIFEGSGDNNTGLEGVAYDPITNSVWGVKEQGPIAIFQQSNIMGSGQSVTSTPFPSNRFTRAGIPSLSDIYVMAASAAFAENDPRRMNILILSRDANMILEMTRSGDIVDQLDIGFLGSHTIEGMTMDDEGNIYLVAEQDAALGGKSQLYVFSAVPEPSALMLGSLCALFLARRKR